MVLLLSLGVTACGNSDSRRASASAAATAPASTDTSGPASPGGSAARIAAAQFIDRYVTSDGRVIRHDQGGDIVSEGQAYGMLIAEIADRPELVRTIWSWTVRISGAPTACSRGTRPAPARSRTRIRPPTPMS